jgi:predicted enzyme related to lactoylglutathione lyase
MSDRQALPGKFVWFELVSRDPKKAQAFYRDVLGWGVQEFPMGAQVYEMIRAGDAMIGGYAAPRSDRQPAHWISYVSVEDVDAAAKAAGANGGKVIDAPYEIPGVGRTARIADPQGAEICPFKNATGDPPDEDLSSSPARAATASQGRFFWNELHTTDTARALAFYEKVVGFSRRAMDVGPGGTYHVLEKNGVGRGGATNQMAPGARPHWLPYVFVDDPDATIAKARKCGATIQFGPEDIPGVGRFGVLQDPTGAVLAVMKPRPAARRA